MHGTRVDVLHRRELCAVFRFHDAFLLPADDRTPPVDAALDVSIPSLRWTAQRVVHDRTYRFSAATLTQPAPAGAGLAVSVTARDGDYLSHEPILLNLPLALSTPPVRTDVLIDLPLWPTPRLRPPRGETAVHGQLRSPTASPVAGLKVEVWTGGSPVPPAGTPFTLTDAHGAFLYRFPRLKAAPGEALHVRIRIVDGLVPVLPAALSLDTGRVQTLVFQRT